MTTAASESTERGADRTALPGGVLEDRTRAVPGGIAVLAVGVLLWVVSGRLGLVGGGVLLAAWAVLPATYAFAVGQVVFVAVTRPDGLLDAGLLPLALVELGLVGVLVGPALRSAPGRRTSVWTVLGTAILGGMAIGSYLLWDRIWLAAGVIVGVGTLGAYGLHRYELVVLGKVPDPDDGGEEPDVDGDRPDDDDGPAPDGDGPDPDGDGPVHDDQGPELDDDGPVLADEEPELDGDDRHADGVEVGRTEDTDAGDEGGGGT